MRPSSLFRHHRYLVKPLGERIFSEPRRSRATYSLTGGTPSVTSGANCLEYYPSSPSCIVHRFSLSCETFATPKWGGGLPSWLIGPRDATFKRGGVACDNYQARQFSKRVTVSGLSIRTATSSSQCPANHGQHDLIPLFSLGADSICILLPQPYHTSPSLYRIPCRSSMIGLPV